jgi:hypothetical protein
VRRQYESISFNNGESLDDFALRLAKMVHELEILGDPEEPRKVAAKYLRIVLKRFAPIAISIESLLDISTMSIEEITGRLRAVEGCGDDDDEPVAGGKLLLTEEQWQATGEGSFNSGSGKGEQKNHPRWQRKKKGDGQDKESFGTESERYIRYRGSLHSPLANQAAARMGWLHSAQLDSPTKHYLRRVRCYH